MLKVYLYISLLTCSVQVSKTLVEMQIENNRLKEEAEQVKFELTNKVGKVSCTLVFVSRSDI